MMLLRIDRSTIGARRRLQLASTLICVCIAPAIHFLALRLRKRVHFPKVAHCFSVMNFAVPARIVDMGTSI